jgi:tetratricopeptide (TPR) repeat protein
LRLGDVANAVGSAARAVKHADRSGDDALKMLERTRHGSALHAVGRREEAQALFADAEQRQRERQPEIPLLYSLQGYLYCDLLLDRGEWTAVRERAAQSLELVRRNRRVIDIALDEFNLGRATLGLVLNGDGALDHADVRRAAGAACGYLDSAAAGLRTAEQKSYMPLSLLARGALCRALGDWDGAARDLDEVEEIATPGPMRLHLCDLARARLALAGCEAFAPLNGLVDHSPPKPAPPDPAEREWLRAEAAEQLRIAADYIEKCGYHRRDEELAELQAVIRGERTFASLPPRV